MNSNSPENEYVADTVALILRLEQRSMGKKARQAFADVEQGKAHLHIPAMVFAEILYLAQRQRIVATLDDVHAYLRDNALCREAPLNFDIVTTAL